MNKESAVICKRLNIESPALKRPPFAGPLGDVILNNVSAQAWEEWLEAQMKIINEQRLDLSEEFAQKSLCDQMVTFLKLEDLVAL